MCRHLSGIAVFRTDAEVTVYMSRKTDSHTEIREEHGLPEAVTGREKRTPVEYVPYGALLDFASWRFEFDEDRPAWWTEAHTKDAIRQMTSFARALWDGKTLTAGGGLYLGSLTTLPEGVTLKAGGNLDLRSLAKWLPRAKVSATETYACGAWRTVAEARKVVRALKRRD